MRFEVPQFIEVEDKIIGPFTWRQFVYLAGGAGAALVLYFTLPFFLFIFVGVPIVILAGFLAFHKVNDRPFSNFLESGFNYFRKNKLYLWRKQDKQIVSAKAPTPSVQSTQTRTAVMTPPENTQVGYTPADSTGQTPHLPSPSGNNITSLSRKLEMSALEQTQE